MDWSDFYLGGVVASMLIVMVAILYNRNMKVGEVLALTVMGISWPISWIITAVIILLKYFKAHKNV